MTNHQGAPSHHYVRRKASDSVSAWARFFDTRAAPYHLLSGHDHHELLSVMAGPSPAEGKSPTTRQCGLTLRSSSTFWSLYNLQVTGACRNNRQTKVPDTPCPSRPFSQRPTQIVLAQALLPA